MEFPLVCQVRQETDSGSLRLLKNPEQKREWDSINVFCEARVQPGDKEAMKNLARYIVGGDLASKKIDQPFAASLDRFGLVSETARERDSVLKIGNRYSGCVLKGRLTNKIVESSQPE